MEQTLVPKGHLTPYAIARLAGSVPTPFYLYDGAVIREKCAAALAMPNAFGLIVRFAMKANSSRALLGLIAAQGLSIDASSLNEARRAVTAGIPAGRIMLTTQEVYPESPVLDHWKADRSTLEKLIMDGMTYNVCSLTQLASIAEFAAANRIALSFRVHPGVGSGESSTRNTGDKYSCFGVHLTDVEKALDLAAGKGIVFNQMHVHIGSGADPAVWRENIDRELGFLEWYFPKAETINFGGGVREARMPDEAAADIADLGAYAKDRIERFFKKTGRKLVMAIEPGTFIVANAGFIVTRVIDKKQTGPDGFSFIVTDGGMEVNTRPLIYGSRHPFYVIGRDGRLKSREENVHRAGSFEPQVVVGRCCESGDSQCLDESHAIAPRSMAAPEIGDYVVIGGAGAYCASMSPFNYNSHLQSAEYLADGDGRIELIRARQTLAQLCENERTPEAT